jgi:hypothetical protein|tara:strand:- start:27 stop:350 length:324 start_codon:yes stop_codon:yes gene_type:complete
MRWYFIVNKSIRVNWAFKAVLKVDPSHLNQLPEERREAGYVKAIKYADAAKTATWKKGEHRIVTIEKNLANVPYDISMNFYQFFTDKPAITTRQIGHGRQADWGEEI